MKESNTAKRLAKNTAYMYIRMFVLMLISLYTSRLVLQILGVEDYGIYSLVGSIVAMFNSLRTIFSSSTQRFLNYEMGCGNMEKLQLIFNMSLIINLLISIIFILITEFAGIYFFEYKANISFERIYAAKIVFQLSLISAVLHIMTTSYDALIIAHEKMSFFAYMSIFEGVLKLIIVYLLTISPFDKLIFYAFLYLVVALLVLIINAIYCHYSFIECKLKRQWDHSYLKNMIGFAGWNFLGNTVYALNQHGLNIVLNIFGGPIVNAAKGISYQINSMVTQIMNNIVVVFNPYCIKTYASGDLEKTTNLIYLFSKLMFFILLLISIPLILMTKEILSLWLVEVPQFTVDFVQITMLILLVRSLHYPIDIVYKSIGKLRGYQIIECIVLSLPIIASYVALRFNGPYYSIFLFLLFFEIINFAIIIFYLERISFFSTMDYSKKVLKPCFLMFLMLPICYIVLNSQVNSILCQIIVSIISMLSITLIMYFIGLNEDEKKQIKSIIKKNKKYE